MTTIESIKGELSAAPDVVYDNLSDLNNLIDYLPKDKVSNWESDGKTCSFKVMGTYTIGLEFSEESTKEHIQLKATDKSPFPFLLHIHLVDAGGEKTSSQIICEAKLNPMLKMMVVKPLKSLFDYIINKSESYFS